MNLSGWRAAFRSSGNGGQEDTLIEAARRGDRRAFDALIAVYEAQLRGFLARRVGPEAVDDLLQETLLAAWVGLPRYDRRSRLKAWLYGIAVHKCADFGRARSRAPHEVPFSGEEEGWQQVEDLYAAAELRETVQAVLSGLPPAQREVVEMYYYAELTLAEIAHALGRNLNTVKYQFYRAHVQVTDALEAALRPGEPDPAAPPPTRRPGASTSR